MPYKVSLQKLEHSTSYSISRTDVRSQTYAFDLHKQELNFSSETSNKVLEQLFETRPRKPDYLTHFRLDITLILHTRGKLYLIQTVF